MSGLAQQSLRARRFVPQPSLRELALEEIRLAITTGQLDEGRTYSAAGLAKELGMSLSPVREAMMSLVSEGTVEAIPNRGFRLRPISADDLEEIIRIRVILSTAAVANLCARVREPSPSPEQPDRIDDTPTTGPAGIDRQLAELTRIADASVAAITANAQEEFFRLDRDFHRLLLEYGLGRRAADISLRLRDQSRIAGPGQPPIPADPQTAADLVQIVGLLAAGQTAEAQLAVTGNLYWYKRIRRDRESEA